MVQIAYRVRHCGWTLDRAMQEIDQSFGLVQTKQGADYRFMEQYVRNHLASQKGAAEGETATR